MATRTAEKAVAEEAAPEPGAIGEAFTGGERELLGSQEFAVCLGEFYTDLADRLLSGALAGFEQAGVEPGGVHVYRVPGAFELPLAAKLCAASGRYGAVVCLGAVIRGETDHYDYVCAEAARGIQQVALDTEVPCAFGLLTCETMEQAIERTGGGKRDQGRNAAVTAMRMYLLAEALS
jgi:6,7-dimethyl-8-ribityllumazine synthase